MTTQATTSFNTTDLTAFQLFWLGINTERAKTGLSELGFGDARLCWKAALDHAARLSFATIILAA